MKYPNDFINKIICGDCIDVMKVMPDSSVDLIITDPPYLIKYKTNYRINKSHDFCSQIKNDNNPQLVAKYIHQCHRIMKNNSAMYMFLSCDNVCWFKKQLKKYFKIKNMIVWVKNHWTAGDLYAQFGKQYELMFLVNKGKKAFNGKRITDIWLFDRVQGKKHIHQNQKPKKLIKQCILKHSNEGDIVFDGFGGVGTVAVACKELDRKFISVEIEEKYIKLSHKRIEAAIGSNGLKRWMR